MVSESTFNGTSGNTYTYAMVVSAATLDSLMANTVVFKLSGTTTSDTSPSSTVAGYNGVRLIKTNEGYEFQISNSNSEENWQSTKIAIEQTTGDLVLAVTVNRDTKKDVTLWVGETSYVMGSDKNPLGFYKTTFDTITMAPGLDASVYEYNGTVTGADIVSLPEPTALALLALGVAGLVLRRKVA